eukprot:jgi/Tetstr1/423095/TSEL_013865.t1
MSAGCQLPAAGVAFPCYRLPPLVGGVVSAGARSGDPQPPDRHPTPTGTRRQRYLPAMADAAGEGEEEGPEGLSEGHAAAAGDASRVILHLDLDCFYCQVEQLRLSIPPGTPVAVQQWEGLIAVNYEARAQGVTRHMRAPDALKACPGLRLVHVETIGDGGGGGGGGEGVQGGAAHSRLKEKACLERYRQASRKIIALIHRTVPGSTVVEKASIDEVYLDVTQAVEEELRGGSGGGQPAGGRGGGEEEEGDEGGAGGGGGLCAWGSVVLGSSPLHAGNTFDRRFAVGAQLCARLRGVVRRELGYTMSGGVAANKLLAKLASAMHKPNQQTLIPARAVAALMRSLPLTKIGKMGGKLGAELQEMGAATAGDVADMPLAALEQRLGAARARWAHAAVRGACAEAVVAKGPPKSMLAAKSFSATSSTAAIRRWLGILADELAVRMALDEATHQRRARNLVLHWRGGRGVGSTWGKERSRSGPMPPGALSGRPEGRAAALAAAAAALFGAAEDTLPCSRLALSTTEFTAAPVAGRQSIQRFFAAASPGAAEAAAPAAAVDDVIAIAENASPSPNQAATPRCEPTAAKPQGHPVSTASFPQWTARFVEPAEPAPAHSPERPPGAPSSEAPAPAPADGGNGGGELEKLGGVDVAEQRRILRDIELRRAREQPGHATGRAPKRRAPSSGGRRSAKQPLPSQRSITSMFSRASSGGGPPG